MRYETANDANSRLANTLVSLKTGEPFYIVGCGTATSAVGKNLVTKKKETRSLDEVNLVPVKLGYVFTGETVAYVMRKPTRKYQQGLNRHNIVVSTLKKGEGEKAPRPRYEFDLAGQEICQTILGKYPDVGTAFQKVRSGEREAMAFSREWAVGTDGVDTIVYHKASVVGFVTNTSVKLLPEYAFLKESLEESFHEKVPV